MLLRVRPTCLRCPDLMLCPTLVVLWPSGLDPASSFGLLPDLVCKLAASFLEAPDSLRDSDCLRMRLKRKEFLASVQGAVEVLALVGLLEVRSYML